MKQRISTDFHVLKDYAPLLLSVHIKHFMQNSNTRRELIPYKILNSSALVG